MLQWITNDHCSLGVQRDTPAHNCALLSADNPLDQLQWAPQEEPGLVPVLSGCSPWGHAPCFLPPLPSIAHVAQWPPAAVAFVGLRTAT